jgi:hypothetical protein
MFAAQAMRPRPAVQTVRTVRLITVVSTETLMHRVRRWNRLRCSTSGDTEPPLTLVWSWIMRAPADLAIFGLYRQRRDRS